MSNTNRKGLGFDYQNNNLFIHYENSEEFYKIVDLVRKIIEEENADILSINCKVLK